ncbi:MAG: FHA domain-containing protein [Planctomycetales bacterium]|nr:FHA domain-containing protein [Planctomycetales bacterium]
MSIRFWTDGKLEVAVNVAGQSSAVYSGSNLPPFLVIGSSHSCDVVLDSPDVPPRAFCVCLDPRNRLWGAMLVRRSSRAKIGFRRVDIDNGLKLGNYQIQFNLDSTNLDSAADRVHDEQSRCVIKWRTGDRSQTQRLRPNRPVMLGRDIPSQVLVDHASVSTAHCALVFDGQQLWVLDAGSTNKIRTIAGSARTLRINDRDVFAVGRVQFKTAIHSKLVPQAEFEQVQHKLDEYERSSKELELQQRAYAIRLDELRAEQDAWIQRREALNEEIQQRVSALESREATAAQQYDEWEQLVAQRTEELAALQTTLQERESKIRTLEKEWNERQAGEERHWQEVANEVKLHKLQLRQQQAQIQRENELSVVQRIRTQRELREREERLNDREKDLIRREIQIEAAFRRLPRDVSNPETENVLPSDSIADSTLLSANDFGDILNRAINQDEQ